MSDIPILIKPMLFELTMAEDSKMVSQLEVSGHLFFYLEGISTIKVF